MEEVTSNFGYCETLEECKSIVTQYEQLTSTKFSTYCRSTKNFGSGDWMSKGHHIYFDVKRGVMQSIPYDGVPFMLIGIKWMQCKYGKDVHKREKEMYKIKRATGKIPFDKPVRKPRQTVKLGCPATIQLVEIIRFPEFSIPRDTLHFRKTTSKSLRERVKNDPHDITTEHRIYIAFPFTNVHRYHDVADVVLNKVVDWKEISWMERQLNDRLSHTRPETSASSPSLNFDNSVTPFNDELIEKIADTSKTRSCNDHGIQINHANGVNEGMKQLSTPLSDFPSNNAQLKITHKRPLYIVVDQFKETG